ncbi:MAG: MBL fold metallo-hydrolase [Candidatus Methylomirabilis oxygeniifera]|uniref:Metallo-beta-lactamase domain-containing protein n=1 Tax=Methylomirabilis oxygeniifera TaxID=671143 RepID=D5MGW3_METO1|nr:MAG: MBL fold metallo-hydrolase [Candidatus Methylomirabilis oxyfera]CBE68994.1 membrane protein of unknown function [Candidatus Methylomirabilis oxyfera]
MNIERWRWYSIAVTVLLPALHGLIAAASRSLAVVAEPVHNLVDFLTAVAMLVGLTRAMRKSEAFPYGLCKVENLAPAGLSGTVFVSVYEIARAALLAPSTPVQEDPWMLALLMVTAAIPFAFSHFDLRAGQAANSSVLIADAREYHVHVFTIGLALWLLISGLLVETTLAAETRATRTSLRITVVYNNVPHAPGLATAWGFAAMVAAGADTVLFDTGGDGPTLLANLRKLDIDPDSVDAIVLSHIHGDHTGGLDDFLVRRPNVTVYLPQSFPETFVRAVERRGARVETVSGPQRLFGNVYTTGELGDGIREQALIIDTSFGLVVMTGCAHPGVVEIAKAARAYLGKEIRLLMGGFHLFDRRPDESRATIEALRRVGVRKVAPSHCTSTEATGMFRTAWGDNFIEGGCGAVIELP